MTLVFRNKGVINETALTVGGVSAKVTENPIGVFGTGVKNAIAIVLRLGGSVEVWKGRKLLKFDVREETVRGQKFNVVTMNGRKLGFTDRLGLNWEPWMAYREFWSNVHDEGGSVARCEPDQVVAQAGWTQFVIECPELERVHEERHRIILQTEPMHVLPGVEVHAGGSDHVYYRGIRVMKLPNDKRSLYTYNLTGSHKLTEDRTLLHPYMVAPALLVAFVQATNMSFLHDILSTETAVRGTLEETLSYTAADHVKPSPQFMEVADQLYRSKRLISSAGGLFRHYQDTLPGYVSPYIVTLSPVAEDVVRRAIELVDRAGLNVNRGALMFKTRVFSGRVEASKDGAITISEKLIQDGPTEVAAAIVEGLARIDDSRSVVAKLSRYVVSGTFARSDGGSDRSDWEYSVEPTEVGNEVMF